MRKTILIFASFVLSIVIANAQNGKLVNATFDFKLIKNGKHIIVPLILNDKDSINVYFDTGAGSTVLDEKCAQKSGIKPNYVKDISGAGGKMVYKIAQNQTIKLNNTSIDSVNIVFSDLARLQDKLGHSFDCIIGKDIMKSFITEINIEEKKIKLYSKNAKLNFQEYTKIPFIFKNDIPIPQFEIEIELSNSKKFKSYVFFDSGAGLNLLINAPFAEKHNILLQADKTLTTTTDNLTTKSISEEIKLKSLKIGNYTFSNFIVGIAHDKSGVSSFEGYLGILGAGIINRFNFILDYDKMMLYLKPNSLFKNEFSIPLIGFTVAENIDGNVYVSSIYKESKAYKTGVRKNDEIISINGKNCANNIKLSKDFLKQKGKKVKIKLKRGDKIIKFKTRVKEIL